MEAVGGGGTCVYKYDKRSPTCAYASTRVHMSVDKAEFT